MGGRTPHKIITDYQSANAGTVSDATNPETLHIVVLTPTI
jgi:hypothetical protein